MASRAACGPDRRLLRGCWGVDTIILDVMITLMISTMTMITVIITISLTMLTRTLRVTIVPNGYRNDSNDHIDIHDLQMKGCCTRTAG